MVHDGRGAVGRAGLVVVAALRDKRIIAAAARGELSPRPPATRASYIHTAALARRRTARSLAVHTLVWLCSLRGTISRLCKGHQCSTTRPDAASARSPECHGFVLLAGMVSRCQHPALSLTFASEAPPEICLQEGHCPEKHWRRVVYRPRSLSRDCTRLGHQPATTTRSGTPIVVRNAWNSAVPGNGCLVARAQARQR